MLEGEPLNKKLIPIKFYLFNLLIFLESVYKKYGIKVWFFFLVEITISPNLSGFVEFCILEYRSQMSS